MEGFDVEATPPTGAPDRLQSESPIDLTTKTKSTTEEDQPISEGFRAKSFYLNTIYDSTLIEIPAKTTKPPIFYESSQNPMLQAFLKASAILKRKRKLLQ